MNELRDPLDDLLADIPGHVVPDARSAWSAGTRRRVRRRTGIAASLVVAAVLVAGLVSVLPRAEDVPPAHEPGSDLGYPTHVDDPWRLRDLPARPGPLSAVVEISETAWLAVSPDGGVWRVPQGESIDSFPPALSDDGRMIGYLTGRTTFVLRDLVSGEETRFDQITDNGTRELRDTWWITPQAPPYWSPDGTRLVLRGGKWVGNPENRGLVLGVDGSAVEVDRREGYQVGWFDDDTLAWLENANGQLRLVATDVTGREVERAVTLDVGRAVARGFSQWSGVLSSDRSRIALAYGNSAGTVAVLSTVDGTLLSREAVGAPDYCSPAWAGDRPAFLNGFGGTGGDVSLDTTDGERMIVVDPDLKATCVLTAVHALAGPRHEGWGARLFGDTWLSWRWQEVGLPTAGALLLGTVLVVVVRRRRRRLSE